MNVQNSQKRIPKVKRLTDVFDHFDGHRLGHLDVLRHRNALHYTVMTSVQRNSTLVSTFEAPATSSQRRVIRVVTANLQMPPGRSLEAPAVAPAKFGFVAPAEIPSSVTTAVFARATVVTPASVTTTRRRAQTLLVRPFHRVETAVKLRLKVLVVILHDHWRARGQGHQGK